MDTHYKDGFSLLLLPSPLEGEGFGGEGEELAVTESLWIRQGDSPPHPGPLPPGEREVELRSPEQTLLALLALGGQRHLVSYNGPIRLDWGSHEFDKVSAA